MLGRASRRVVAVVAAVGLAWSGFVGGAAAQEGSAPEAPSNLRAEVLESHWARIGWDAPPGDTHRFYRAELRKPGDPDYRQGPNTVFFATSTSFGALDQATTYVVSVRTVEAGVESAAVTFEFTTPFFGDPPEAPSNLRAVEVDGVLDRVEWDPPANNSDVRYQVLSSSPVSPILLLTDRTWFEVSELLDGYPVVDPGSIHTLTVVARDAGGNASEPSEPLTVRFPS